ncbi:MAG: TonB-dependent receptor [Methylococcales bacterium]|nr:TonB-dependent receptor [Methylococcales bacterium]
MDARQTLTPLNKFSSEKAMRIQKIGLVLLTCSILLHYVEPAKAENNTNNSVADTTETKADKKNAKSKAQPKDEEPLELSTMEVTAIQRADNLVGIATSASQGNIGQEQIKYRPITRPSEILETVPGMISSQHSGEGKASQYYLRGFNLDHGTDFLTQIDGVPINMTSHSHGQGWMDTNFLIPEMVKSLHYQKGNYYADTGDFSSTGSANIEYFNELPETTVKFTGGSYDYYRGLSLGSKSVGGGNILFAGEVVHNNGPWEVGNEYMKFNGVLRYSQEHGETGWSITAMAYKADWNSTDQIPQRAVKDGSLNRFGAIDATDGGNSQRYSVTGEWHRQAADSESKVMAYGVFSKLNLYSNFTYYLNDPVRGDQFGQPDKRWTSGLKATHTFFHKIVGAESETTIGLQVRNDNIHNALTLNQGRYQYGIIREDDVWVTNASPYAENKTRWNDWFRSSVGLRFDGYQFDVSNSNQAANNGTRYDGMVSPKLALTFGPWADTEIYLNGGLGFHSNDARGINTQVDPVTGNNTDADGNAINKAVPLARTYGAEVGLRSTWVPGLQSTLAFWWLDIDSELLFVGDAGTTEASRPSRRYGVEFANYYSPTDWLTFDMDYSASHSQFRGNAPEGNYIPGSISTVLASGVTVHDVWGGFFGGPRLRYFGPRSLIEDNSVRSDSTIMLSGMVGYKFNRNWTVQAEVFNLLNRKDSGIDYYYESQLRNEAAPVNDIHFHPVEPISFRMTLSASF